MAEDPDNIVLHLLGELRHDNLQLRQEINGQFAQLRPELQDMSKELRAVSQMARGKSVLGRYAALEVDDRLEAIEKRLNALEHHS